MIQNVQILAQNAAYWQDHEWKKLLSNAIESPVELLKLLDLAPQQLPNAIDIQQKFPQKVPLPFIARMEKANPKDPLLRQVLPLAQENQATEGFSANPLEEKPQSIPGLLHKYQSRVLFMLATHCAINCRYCFRREFPYAENRASREDWRRLKDYIATDPKINEVIISGGDPLAVSDKYLFDFISFIESIPQIKRLRIHTRLPVVIPQRITQSLVSRFEQSPLQLVMVVHINHANEIDDNVKNAMTTLKKAGVHLLNQSVLLRGVNDSAKTLTELSERLFDAQIQPYYLHLLDKVSGSSHFDVSQSEALQLLAQLQKQVAGFLVPKLVREEAGKPNKTLINLTS
ncbi:EF-P beta-lysylation protein EpmB [Kangiella sp. TOML190]|uniref:EF-P beta-lysylation protein EpmB n=1 Tax=Kangiella sp. TOML190 TaxID=2931351 RepID=UPI00203E6348|nr:EF-P beta-lysylation protein EpmB [Kangiella sp. TOML190]